MKKIAWVGLSLASVSLFIGCQSGPKTPSETPAQPISEKVCPAELKQCSDGTWVERQGPDCQYPACPQREPEVALPEVDVLYHYKSLDTAECEGGQIECEEGEFFQDSHGCGCMVNNK